MSTESPTPRNLFNELTHELSRYVRGEVTLQAFHFWFAPILWKVEVSDEPDAEELAYDITLRLSEYSHGQWSEEQLKTILSDLIHVPAGAAWHDDTHPTK